MGYNLNYIRFGASAILIEWPQKITTSILDDILLYKRKIEQSNPCSLQYINHAYASLLLHFDKEILDFPSEIKTLEAIYAKSDVSQDVTRKLWKIPVCYDKRFGIDLGNFSKEKNIEIDDIIQRHTSPIYTVFFIGFLPGFLYLGGLDKTLYLPRRSSPRLKIPKGSVAIGGEQTGIYPSESPGGWHIIGNCPLDFFNASKEAPCFAKAGDSLEFYSVSLEEYNSIKASVENGSYQIENKVLHG